MLLQSEISTMHLNVPHCTFELFPIQEKVRLCNVHVPVEVGALVECSPLQRPVSEKSDVAIEQGSRAASLEAPKRKPQNVTADISFKEQRTC